MKILWMVVRKEKHRDDKCWVCETEDVAFKVADHVAEYWKGEYGPGYPDGAEDELVGNEIYRFMAHDCFDVTAFPVRVMEASDAIDMELSMMDP